MTFIDWLTVAAVLICLLISAFFSASETALTASSRAAMARLDKQGNRDASIVNRLLSTRERFLGAVLFANNLTNIAASTLATGLLLALFGKAGVIYATLVMTVLIFVLSEVLPKTAAFNMPDRMALAVAKPIDRTVQAFVPILKAVEWLVRLILRGVGMPVGKLQSILAPREELRGAVDLLHRTKMVMLNADESPRDIVDAVLAAAVTRLPLWRGSPDNIIGVLHAKDLLRAYVAAGGDAGKLSIADLTLEPWFIPESTTLRDQLQEFLRRKTHSALVVDEYGVVQGLITLEDIIEEIVGDIRDEHDVAVLGVRKQRDGSVVVDGSSTIRELNRAVGWNLPDDEAATVAGLVIHEARSIPEARQTFSFHGFRFEVLRKQRNRIAALRITPLALRTGERG